jgi:hypothetical protein
MGILYFGKPVEELTREELIKALEYAFEEMKRMAKRHQEIVDALTSENE